MAKTIKVIDLLNKIANGEEVPEKIEYQEEIYTWDNELKKYATETGYTLEIYTKKIDLLEPIEILEEQQDIDIQEIEEVGEMLGWALISLEEEIEGQKESINFTLDFFGNKINDLIKNQNLILQAVKQLDKK